MGRYCVFCGRVRPNEAFSRKGMRDEICKRCARTVSRSEGSALRAAVSIGGFMQQENISAKNIAKLREYAESSDDEIRRCATTALRIANIAPRKKHRIASLLRRDPDLIVEAAVDDLLAYEPTNGPTLGQLVAAVKAAPMRHFRRPWCLAGGWALEIWDDFIARRHSDIDIAVLREDQFELRQHLSRWQFQKSVRGTLLPWEEGERLELPIHEIHATPPGSDRSGI